MIDLLGRHMGLVQLHCHRTMLPVLTGELPALGVHRLQHGQMLATELLQAGQLLLQVEVQVSALHSQRFLLR